jgi:hypothetical protein
MRARHLALHHNTISKLARLKKDPEHAGAFRVAKRLHAVLLNAEDYTSGSIARILAAPLAKVSEWLRNYERYGYEGLLEGHRCRNRGRIVGIVEESWTPIYCFFSWHIPRIRH